MHVWLPIIPIKCKLNCKKCVFEVIYRGLSHVCQEIEIESNQG